MGVDGVAPGVVLPAALPGGLRLITDDVVPAGIDRIARVGVKEVAVAVNHIASTVKTES